MKIKFIEETLDRMECELGFTAGLPASVASAYRGRLQTLRAAQQEQALQHLQSFQLRSCGNGSYFMRVTDEWDLVVAFQDSEDGRVAVVDAMVNRKITKTEPPS